MLPRSLRGSCWDTGDTGVWKSVPGPFCTGMLAATSRCRSGTSAGTSRGGEGMLTGQSKRRHSQCGPLPTGAAASPISLLKWFEAPFVPCGGSVRSLPAEVEMGACARASPSPFSPEEEEGARQRWVTSCSQYCDANKLRGSSRRTGALAGPGSAGAGVIHSPLAAEWISWACCRGSPAEPHRRELSVLPPLDKNKP